MKTLKQSESFVSLITILTFGIITVTAGITSAETPKEIRIGATVSMSGKFSTEVGPFKQLMDAYAAEINDQGGIYVKAVGSRLPIRFIV